MSKVKGFLSKYKLVVVGVVCFGIGFFVAPYGISEEDHNEVKDRYESAKSELSEANNRIATLESKVEEAEPFFKMDDAEKEAMKIEADKKAEEIKKEKERIAEEERIAALEARTVTLGNGTYLIGQDIPEGVYDLYAVKGGGNVQSTRQINVIMGVSGDGDFYQREQQNVALKEGTTIDLKGVTVKFVPDDNYVIKN